MIRVFLIDDHAVLRQGLRRLIEEQPEMMVAGEYGQARGAAEAACGAGSDVVVVDISMPDAGGASVTEELKQQNPFAKVLALSRHAERAYVQQMIRAGAVGYVLKQSPVEVLIAGIRAVAGGETFIDSAVAAATEEPAGVVRPGGSQAVSQREQEIVALVADGYTNKEISARLGITVKTVESHKTNIMGKLGLRSRAELVRFAVSQGWLNR